MVVLKGSASAFFIRLLSLAKFMLLSINPYKSVSKL